ncbi:flagellar motor protein MotB [Natranaerofaba carboxydovora]|uniref:flagellar motor protein MotB n=1 Tax=Natranaerofaba carboxydovora TaxID=2742683 RepID=UPI001F12CA78|nr:flagellar motor protein MotB [Natranaerofaba carboxydovora]UMZ73368.1 Motility protein B [Natranaerofaba carboxydovora]
MARHSRRKRKEEEAEDTEAWLRTYGDMITLLLCFFVLLFSFSTIDDETFDQIMISLHQSFSGVLPEGRTMVPPEDQIDIGKDEVPEDPELDETQEEEVEEMKELQQQIEEYIEERDLDDVMSIIMDERGLMLRFQDKILFDTARAELRDEAENILSEISVFLNQVDNEITIEGHTDDRPMRGPQFDTNWELSTGRATSVLRFLAEDNDIEPHRLSAIGYGEYRPLVPNDSPDNMQLNRRVDMTILWSTFERGEFLDRGADEDLMDVDDLEEFLQQHDEDVDNIEEFIDEGG